MKTICDRLEEERAKIAFIEADTGDHARAAACYALGKDWGAASDYWPFRPLYIASMDRRTELIRAVAHILQELESLNVPKPREATHD